MAEPLRYDMTLPNGAPLRWDMPGARWDGTVEEVMAALNPTTNSMNQNLVSSTLAAPAVTNITTAIATIRMNLPFLVALTKDQRQSLVRGGDGSQAFIQASLTFAAQHPEALPATFSAAEFAKDGALQSALAQVTAAIAQLNEDVQDTNLALNSDLLVQALDVYAFAKANNRGGAYDSYVDTAKVRFAKSPRKPATPAPAP